MTKVAMFVANPCVHDTRVMKQANTLSNHGYSVRIYALANGVYPKGLFIQSGYSIQRISIPALRRSTKKPKISSRNISQETVIVRRFRYLLKRILKIFIRTPLKIFIRTPLKIFIRTPLCKYLQYYLFCRIAAHEAEKWGTHVVHAHDLNTMFAARIVKKRIDAKVIYDSHELWIHRNRPRHSRLSISLDTCLSKIFERSLIASANEVITVSDSIKHWLTKQYSLKREPIVIRNVPLRDNAYPNHSSPAGIKDRLDLPENSLVLVYIGKITHGRGIEVGIRALKHLDHLYFVLLGHSDTNYSSMIEALATNLGIADRFIICDPVPSFQIISFIQGSDFSLVHIEPVCLSYEFSLPNKIFESIQANIPILASNLPEIKKIVESYNLGACFTDEHDLVEKIISAGPQQTKIWKKNMTLCSSEFCWEVEQNKLLNIYRNLMPCKNHATKKDTRN